MVDHKNDDDGAFTIDIGENTLAEIGNEMPSVTKIMENRGRPPAISDRQTLGDSMPPLSLAGLDMPPPLNIAVEAIDKNSPGYENRFEGSEIALSLEELLPPQLDSGQNPPALNANLPNEPSDAFSISIDDAPQAPIQIENADSSRNDFNSSHSSSNSQVKINKATRRNENKSPAIPLSDWESPTLSQQKDPLAKVLSIFFLHGASEAVVFRTVAGSPTYFASNSVDAKNKKTFWEGMKWDPKILPETTKQLSASASIEIAPPPFGKTQNQGGEKFVLRNAFCLKENEFLTLIRMGNADSCQGIIGVLSKQPVQFAMPEALGLLRKSTAAKAA